VRSTLQNWSWFGCAHGSSSGFVSLVSGFVSLVSRGFVSRGFVSRGFVSRFARPSRLVRTKKCLASFVVSLRSTLQNWSTLCSRFFVSLRSTLGPLGVLRLASCLASLDPHPWGVSLRSTLASLDPFWPHWFGEQPGVAAVLCPKSAAEVRTACRSEAQKGPDYSFRTVRECLAGKPCRWLLALLIKWFRTYLVLTCSGAFRLMVAGAS
jgi:hypothetical protein